MVLGHPRGSTRRGGVSQRFYKLVNWGLTRARRVGTILAYTSHMENDMGFSGYLGLIIIIAWLLGDFD